MVRGFIKGPCERFEHKPTMAAAESAQVPGRVFRENNESASAPTVVDPSPDAAWLVASLLPAQVCVTWRTANAVQKRTLTLRSPTRSGGDRQQLDADKVGAGLRVGDKDPSH